MAKIDQDRIDSIARMKGATQHNLENNIDFLLSQIKELQAQLSSANEVVKAAAVVEKSFVSGANYANTLHQQELHEAFQLYRNRNDVGIKCKGINCSAVNGVNHSPECIQHYHDATGGSDE